MNDLKSFDVYLQLLTKEIDESIFNVEHKISDLQQIYDSLFKFQIQEERPDKAVQQLINGAKGLTEVRPWHKKPLTDYQKFKETLSTFKTLPFLNRTQLSEKFSQKLKQLCLPTASHSNFKVFSAL
jgi:hypothetical protein